MNPSLSNPKDYLSLNDLDSVVIVTALNGLKAGTILSEFNTQVNVDIPRGHKVAIKTIAAGQPVFKLGHMIGIATQTILSGDHVHVHNVRMPELSHMGMAKERTGRYQDPLKTDQWKSLPDNFYGYVRKNGTAGIRNYVVVVGTVNCSATVVKAVCRHFLSKDSSAYLSEQEIHGVIPITHSAGCAQAIGGTSYEVLNRTLAGWIFHPNVVGAVVIGLGCEGTTFKSILKHQASRAPLDKIPLRHFDIQSAGGTACAIQAGIEQVNEVVTEIIKGGLSSREKLPVSHLKIALNCGGSDAFSSLTANPGLGIASDILVSKGGTVALAEIPECTGAEDLLYHRCAQVEIREKLQAIYQGWQEYAKLHHVEINDNLAPGNIAGGITTIIEKSLGAVAKAGSTELTQVVDYSEAITQSGFVLMNTPGFDPVSVTGLVAGGCTMVAFTTGLGSVYGCGIAPTVKIATTSELFKRLAGDMDVDAGQILSSGSFDATGVELYNFMIEVASGKKTCSEELGLGWEEFVPWNIGETL